MKIIGAITSATVGAIFLFRGIAAHADGASLISPVGRYRFPPLTPSQSMLVGGIILVLTSLYIWKAAEQKRASKK